MMAFGWSPNLSCYSPAQTASGTSAPPTGGQIGPVSQTTIDQAAQQAANPAPCASAPTWWLSLMTLAAIAGIATRSGR